jgi:ribosomal protein S18 acetylase RimI-like enzyme
MPTRAEAVLQVRRASEADARFAVQLGEQAFGEFDPGAARTTARLLRDTGAETLVAVFGDQPAGFVIVEVSAGLAHVNAIAVAADQRGKGIGQRLMEAAERSARRRNAQRLLLHTAQANVAALALFLRCGFSIRERSAAGYSRPQPTCRLEKLLR